MADSQYLKGAYKKAEEGLFKGACCDRKRVKGFKIKEGRFRLEIGKKYLHYERGKTLEQVMQRSCGCAIPGGAQG